MKYNKTIRDCYDNTIYSLYCIYWLNDEQSAFDNISNHKVAIRAMFKRIP